MKCLKHYERDAVSQCVDCGKALCPECTNKFHTPLCDQCSLNRISISKKLLIKNTAIMVVLFIVGFFNAQSGEVDFSSRLLMGYAFAGIPWGWSILNSITPNIFLFMPIIGWIMYFAFKIMLSMLIGMFVTPYKIYTIYKGINDAKFMENYTKNAV